MHGGRNLQLTKRPSQLDRAVSDQHAFIEKRLYQLLYKQRIALGAFEHQPLERRQFRRVANPGAQHLARTLLVQWVEPKLCVVGL